EAISIIADSDFWEDWDTLVQDLVNRLSSTDPKVTNGVLEVAHSIFVRWRPLFRTDELYIEINHVLSVCGEPFIQMLEVRVVHDSLLLRPKPRSPVSRADIFLFPFLGCRPPNRVEQG
ncbi:MAG: hypothetical protein OK454_10285, partial [Thaumarchaeota archaeon]|nr:hypothetical protein [Nitrososphaerota archaeon]